MKLRRIYRLANAAGMFWIVSGTGVIAGLLLSMAIVGIPRAEHPPIFGPLSLEFLDLAAQRSMSDAAWWMVAVSCASALVGTFGLYLIARTLQEAKRSADAAHLAVEAAREAAAVTQKIGQAQVRAYLVIVGATLIVTDRFNAKVTVTIRNSGQSPAKEIWARTDFRVEAVDEDGNDVADSHVDDMQLYYLQDISSSTEQVITYDLKAFEFNKLEDADPDAPMFPGLYVMVEFHDVFGHSDTVVARLSATVRSLHAQRELAFDRDEL